MYFFYGDNMEKQKKKLGLVLGAGASRGFAHIGVLKSLVKHNIPIDIITGTSMGSLVGGLYCTGGDLEYIENYAKNLSVSKLLDISVKDGGFVRGRRIEEILKIVTRNKSIEQLNIPFACAAIDIQTGEVKIFRSGGLYEAIRASISMPGIFAPYEIDGHTYIDGGTLQRMPVHTAKEMGADVILAVDVSYRGQKRDTVPNNAITTLTTTLSFTTWRISQEQEKEADMVLTPDVFRINPYSAKESAICIEEGERAMDERIDELIELLK